MTTSPRYATASAFRQALEARLNQLAEAEGADIQRLRRQLAFDRLLCRLVAAPNAPVVLKGGYAMELRLQATRTTKDIDLAWRSKMPKPNAAGAAEVMRQRLQELAAADLGDHFVFLISAAAMDLDAAPYGGSRFPVEARMAGRRFASFHIDVGIGDCVLEPLEEVTARDWLDFAGIPARPFAAINREQQFAEKLHAYTLPRPGTTNSRVRDLVDMVLLCQLKLDPARARAAIGATFDRRATHPVPENMFPPPKEWQRLYQELAAECRLAATMDEAYEQVAAFVRKIISG